MTKAIGNDLHIIIKNCNPQEQRDDLIQALGNTVKWFSTMEDRKETDDQHLHVIGKLIEELAPSE